MPDIKLVLMVVIGVAALVALAGAFAWLLAHIMLVVALLVAVGGAIYALRQRNLRRRA